MLLAWIFKLVGTHAEHKDWKLHIGRAEYLALRKDAREWLKTQEGAELAFGLEEAVRARLPAGEDSELEVIS